MELKLATEKQRNEVLVETVRQFEQELGLQQRDTEKQVAPISGQCMPGRLAQ